MTAPPVTHIQSRDNAFVKDLRRLPFAKVLLLSPCLLAETRLGERRARRRTVE